MLSTWTAGQAHSADPGKQSTEPMVGARGFSKGSIKAFLKN